MEGPMKPLLIRLSQVRMLLCPISQRKVLMFGHILESHIFLYMWDLGSVEKLDFRPYASLIMKVSLGVCPQCNIFSPCLTLIMHILTSFLPFFQGRLIWITQFCFCSFPSLPGIVLAFENPKVSIYF